MKSADKLSGGATTHSVPLLVESSTSEQFALFPSELGGGVRITQGEMLQWSHSYSLLYETYSSRLSARVIGHFDITEPAANILTRRVLVPLIHCFMDRLIRVGKALDCAPKQLVVPRQELFPATDTIEAFEQCAVENPVFNQSMIWFVSRVWQLPEFGLVPEQPLSPSLQSGFRNNSFRMYPKASWRFVKKVYLRFLAVLLSRSRFPALTMAYATGPLLDHGFYVKYLQDVNRAWPLPISDVDETLRGQLFSDNFIESNELKDFLSKVKLKPHEQKNASRLLKEFLQHYYPTSLLEAIPQNMMLAARALRPFKKMALISVGEASWTCSTYVLAAARQAGLSIVKGQHGGHYGYIEDMRGFMEILYPGANQFVSWGWSRLPDHPALKGLSVIALPSPWLSERKHYWAELEIEGEKEFDFLLMPNMVKRFPAAPHGASTSRIDLIQEFAASLKQLVRKGTGKGFRILHKPYNPTTVRLLATTMKELESIGGARYFCEAQLDKGLTHKLVGRCHVVLWDQPGTGFLECLSSGIPTLVYWPRIYNHEEEWAKPFFADLERCGIVHCEVESLLDEFEQYRKSPHLWMKNPERVSCINRFCREFAWTSDDWPKHWREYLDGLSHDSKVDGEQKRSSQLGKL